MSSNSSALQSAHQDAISNPPASTTQKCPRKSWVEIHLEDEDGNPVANQEYKIVAPDGSEYTGTLDENGLARVAGIDPGQCQITFPDLHQKEWNPK